MGTKNVKQATEHLVQIEQLLPTLNTTQKWAMYQAFKASSDSLWSGTKEDASQETSTQFYYAMGTLILRDPASSIHDSQSYMDRLELICDHLDKTQTKLYFDTYVLISRIYLLNGLGTEAYTRLEKLAQHIVTEAGVRSVAQLPKSHKMAPLLKKVLLKEMLCYKAIPDSIAQRNREYLKGWSDKRKALALALVDKDYKSVLFICNSFLKKNDVEMTDRLFLMQIKIDILSMMPPNEANAEEMLHLIKTQDSIFMDISKHKEADYASTTLLQKHKTVLSDLETTEKKREEYFLHFTCGLLVLALALMTYIYVSYRRRIQFRHRLFEDMEKARKERREALTQKQLAFNKQTLLVRNLNHEIRGSLNALIGFSNIIASTEHLSKVEKEETEEIILSSSHRLTSLINNLLDLARLETGKMNRSMSYIQIKDVFLKKDWTNLRASLQSSHTLKLNVHEVDSVIYTDKSIVKRIVGLLVMNAQKVSDDGEITIALYRRQSHRVELLIASPTCNMPFEEVLLAMDEHRGMNDYDNSDSYYLVLARMLTKLIEAEIMVDFSQEKGLHVQVLFPIIKKR